MAIPFIGLDPVSAATPEAYLDDYTVWNFRFAWQSAAAEGLELAAFVNNLAEEDYFGSGIALIACIGAVGLIPGKQRTYGVEVYYNW